MWERFERRGEPEAVKNRILTLVGEEAGFMSGDGRSWTLAEVGGLKMVIARPERILAVYKNGQDGRKCFLLDSVELSESGEEGVVLAVVRQKSGEWLTAMLPVRSSLCTGRWVKFDSLYYSLDISFLNDDDGGDWKWINVDRKFERRLKPNKKVMNWQWFKRLIFVRT